jgi:hypothetical protein
VDRALFDQIEAVRGEDPRLRLTWHRGALELCRLGHPHRQIEETLCRMLQEWVAQRSLPLGRIRRRSWADAGGAFCLSPGICFGEGEEVQLVIDVITEKPEIERGPLWRALPLRELWIWYQDELQVHRRGPAGWSIEQRSELLPGLDLELLGGLAAEPEPAEALRAFLAETAQMSN